MAALFGAQVRRLRLSAGLTQARLGAMTHVVGTRITQVERCSGAKPTLELAKALDAALGADGLLVDLWPHVYRESFPDWSRTFMAYAAQAVAIRQYTAHVVPGLLQTEDYARALLGVDLDLRDEAQLEERLTARLARQNRLDGPGRPELLAILDEAVLRRPVGGEEAMREQLARLVRTAAERQSCILVLPFAHGEHDMLGGSLTVLRLPNGAEVAYCEGAHHGQLFEDPHEVRKLAETYDRLRLAALPARRSLRLIRSAMEDYRDPRLPSRSDRRRLAQEQLQQPGGRRLRRGGARNPRHHPRP
ncbi:Scr1 family TA system antitoxin-like transcriptional regulator [Streptomyces sp. NPDC090026]|uniref:helix-turn-helix domain-containing protein n=1 Tax=Streptomyces sp. NPDC090026 TaxID=3365923 RepID=UPI0038049EE3